MTTTMMRFVLGALLVGTAVVFLIAVGSEQRESSGHQEGADETGSGAVERGEGEQVLGIDIESPLLVTLAVALSVIGAALVAWRPSRPVLVAVAIFAAGFGALDIGELINQAEESRSSVAALAAILAVLHFAAVGLAVKLWRTDGHQQRTEG